MKKYSKYIIVVSFLVLIVAISCKDKISNNDSKDGIVEGTVSMIVDETVVPIIEDEVQVFENNYKAKINLKPLSETEAVLSLTKKESSVAILSRKLTDQEESFFKNKKIYPRVTKIAIDAIALVKSKSTNDTLVDLNEIVAFLQGKQNAIKGLVFDNPNSSTARYFKELAKIDNLPVSGVYSFKTNDEVLKYVAKNDGMLGVVGLNWISQPEQNMISTVDNLNILSVKNTDNQYVSPTQDNIASGKYPLARDLYIVNCQGYEGLGIGFASFVAGEIGQRIILKSGLVPVKMPGRNIIIQNKISK